MDLVLNNLKWLIWRKTKPSAEMSSVYSTVSAKNTEEMKVILFLMIIN